MTQIELQTLNMVKNACNSIIGFIGRYRQPNWEQRRYEIAKDFATRMYASSCYTGNKKDAIRDGVKFADDLIAELQKPTQATED